VPELQGRDIGGYTVVSLLGRGGMGEVYRARDVKLGRDVAIKILPADIAASPERVARPARKHRSAGPWIFSFCVRTRDPAGGETDPPTSS
jgi:serine/threonine protein kinase